MLSILLIILKLMGINLMIVLLTSIISGNILWSFIIVTAIFWTLFFVHKCCMLPLIKIKMERVPKKYTEEVKTITVDGFTFRDLNKNGKLDVYKDSRQPIDARVENLMSLMTVEEKAGLLFNHFTFVNDPDDLTTKQDELYHTFPEDMIFNNNMNTFTLFGGYCTPEQSAKVTNKLQYLASKTRLGIPVTICSDPRHHYDAGVGTGASQHGISRWPE